MSNINKNKLLSDVDPDQEQIIVQDPIVDQPIENDPNKDPIQVPDQNQPVQNPDVSDPTIPVVNPEPVVFELPVENYTIGGTFSDTTLVYNASLNEWSTHIGVDFISPNGTDVKSIYNGTVESIDYSALEGTCITIVHEGNIKSIYKSLSNEVFVEVGSAVVKGQVIGKVSDSADSEKHLGAHLHLEVMQDQNYIDPMSLFEDK